MAARGDAATDDGVQFPLVDDRRSTTATGTAVFADAAREVAPELADEIATEQDWRRNYIHHLRRLTEAELGRPDVSPRVPTAGLESLHERMVFLRGGDERPLADALENPRAARFATYSIHGPSDRVARLEVPYRGQLLAGDGLKRQLEDWVDRGICEPSFAEAVGMVVDEPGWLDLRGERFVLMGAGAELGPLDPLLTWGAHVTAVDVPVESVWRRIVDIATRAAGSLDVPVRPGRDDPSNEGEVVRHAGMDLITEMPEVADWLGRLDGPATLGNYVYADGADNVRVSVAVDAITEHLLRSHELSLAVLATPTDVYAVSREAAEESRRRYEQRGRTAEVAESLTRGRLFAPNYRDDPRTGRPLNVADAQVPQQGPNYGLAKHLHRWRARQARTDGLVSSINVAPPTRTHSVTKNRLLAAAYRGASAFAVEVFEPDTARTLMAAMLVHDLKNERSSAHPDAPLAHPLEQLVLGANHGGLWRIPHAPRSVLGLAAMLGLARPGG